jgi:taurine dioxygenase
MIRRLGYALGAEVTGVDLSRPLDDVTVAELRRAWLDHQVLCFRDQRLSRKEDLVAFASRFGEIDRLCNPKQRDSENPDIQLVTNKPRDGKPWDGHIRGEVWHSDQSYTLCPNVGTFLLAKELPDVGGSTLFANQYSAYLTLSTAMKDIVEMLSAVHDVTKAVTSDVTKAKRATVDPPVVHPVVKLHPETQQKVLFVGERMRQFVGMTPEESRPLIDFLVRHAVTYEFTYQHRWRVNDLLMWDNRCLMHYAVSDYDQLRQARHMWRCSLLGPETGRLYRPDDDAASREHAAAGVS